MNKRLTVALACSLALHALLLAMLQVGGNLAQQGNVKEPLQVYLQADTAIPSPPAVDAGQEQRDASRPDGRSRNNALLPEIATKERYLLPSEVDIRAQPVKMPALIYPEKAQRMKIGGLVRLRVYIGKNGKIDAVDVVAANPPGVFEGAALQALLSTSFTPARKNGRAVKSQKLIEIKFDPYEINPS